MSEPAWHEAGTHADAAGGPTAAPAAALRSWPRRHRRALWLGGVLAVLALLAVGAGASWRFAAKVVVPERHVWPDDTTVQAVAPGRVVLTRSEWTARPGVYGLEWRGGRAIVAAVLGGTAHTVTRRLSAISGRLRAGTSAAVEPVVYHGDPTQALGLPFAAVRVPDELGPMPAWLVPGRTDTWAIVVHGINGNRENVLRIAPPLHADGLPALLITYREDAGAPASPDGLHHMGLTEWRDLQAAARYALAHGARRLVLVGYSMGGAIVAQFMERSPLARRVGGLVLDSPALDWRAILAFNATELGLPSVAAAPVEWMIGARIDADWDSLDALRHTRDFHLPILLYHGTDDELVPLATSTAFARALPGWVTYYRVPYAGHTESWNVDPGLYDRRLAGFLTRIGVSTAR